MSAVMARPDEQGGKTLAKRKINSNLARQLRQAILDSGLSLYELSRRSTVHSAMLSRFMRNERTLTLPAASRICDVLGLHLCVKAGPGEKPKRKKQSD
jgi:ribosome-binding protein aMBF1 (putative translation factor)